MAISMEYCNINCDTGQDTKLNGYQSGELQYQLTLDKINMNDNNYGELQYQC